MLPDRAFGHESRWRADGASKPPRAVPPANPPYSSKLRAPFLKPFRACFHNHLITRASL